jgi:hypothetical protein
LDSDARSGVFESVCRQSSPFGKGKHDSGKAGARKTWHPASPGRERHRFLSPFILQFNFGHHLLRDTNLLKMTPSDALCKFISHFYCHVRAKVASFYTSGDDFLRHLKKKY